MTISETIRDARLRAGLTQQKLAELCGVTYRTVQRWEAGDRLVPVTLLRTVASVLNLSIEDLIP